MSPQETAQRCDQMIRQSADVVRKGTLIIGWYGQILKERNLFGELGFASEEEYYRSCGIGRSTWYRTTAIAAALKELGRDAVLAMKVENARLLAKASSMQRLQLLQSATAKPIREFSREVREVIGRPLGAIQVRTTALTVEMSQRQRIAVNEIIEMWMARHGVKDRGTALEQIARCAFYSMLEKKTA